MSGTLPTTKAASANLAPNRADRMGAKQRIVLDAVAQPNHSTMPICILSSDEGHSAIVLSCDQRMVYLPSSELLSRTLFLRKT